MYALAMSEETYGGGWLLPRPTTDEQPIVPLTGQRESERQDEPAEELGLSAIRELAFSLGLSESEDPALCELV